MEDDLKKKRRKKDDLNKKMEDDLNKNNNGRRPQKIKWKTNQSNKINLIGCDTIVNSPSRVNYVSFLIKIFIYAAPSLPTSSCRCHL